MPRLFVAVDLPDPLREDLAKSMDGVHGARWANAKQLHITLRFMGDTAEEDLPRVRARLAQVAQPAFRLRVCGAGVFPEAKQGSRQKPPRVLWLGIQPTEELASLERAVDAALSAAPAENQFSPHLTLARFSARPDQTLSDFLRTHAGYTSPYWWVTDFHLYQSTLRREGALHTRVASYPLVGTERGE